MRFDNRPAHPSMILYILVSVVSWPFLVGLVGSAANSSAGSPAAEDGPPGLTEIGGSNQCQIEFRTKANTLEEDAWVVFSISSMHITPTVAAFRYRLKDLDDSRVAPGERLIAATSRKVSCDREWRFYIDVRMGSPLSFLATKDVRIDLVIDQRGSDQDEVIVELGSPACWAAHADGFLDEEDLLAGCETGEEENPEEVVEIGGSKRCQIEFRTKANTLEEDAWVVFSISSMHITPTVAAFRYRLKDLDDSRVAPGERLIAATSRKASCDREWRFYVDVRMGSPLSFLATKDVRIDRVIDQRGSDQDEVIVELGSPACWAAHADGFLDEEDLLAGCETGEEENPVQVTGPIRISNFRSGPICDAGDAEIGRPPSDRICEARDVPVRGKDICVYNEEEVRCTWWGFEFDYENADPNEPITCIWTRDRPINEGNYEGIRKSSIATDTVSFKVEETRGHYVSYMYDNHMWNAPPWLTVETEYLCEYRGQPLFTATYRMIHTSAFR